MPLIFARLSSRPERGHSQVTWVIDPGENERLYCFVFTEERVICHLENGQRSRHPRDGDKLAFLASECLHTGPVPPTAILLVSDSFLPFSASDDGVLLVFCSLSIGLWKLGELIIRIISYPLS